MALALVHFDDPAALRPGPIEAKVLADNEIPEAIRNKRGPKRRQRSAYLEPAQDAHFLRCAERLAKLHDELAIGAPTSTDVSNWIMRRGMRDILGL